MASSSSSSASPPPSRPSPSPSSMRKAPSITSINAHQNEDDLTIALRKDGVAQDSALFYHALTDHHLLSLTTLLAHRPWTLSSNEAQLAQLLSLARSEESKDEIRELAMKHFGIKEKLDTEADEESVDFVASPASKDKLTESSPLLPRANSDVQLAVPPTHRDLPESHRASLSWQDVGYRLPKNTGKSCRNKFRCCKTGPCACKEPAKPRRQILHGISGHLPAGKLLAIMGSSGAGKTTFLDVLAGRTKVGKVSGHVFVNGQPAHPDWKHHAGYVMQDDAFVPTLTVAETLHYSIRLKLGRDVESEEMIAEILNTLNLNKTRDTQIGDPTKRGISGGERKRLSIGVEMVTSPSVLFLDEPTSGLDSRNALRVMEACKRLCERGHTVVTTIHQPRSNIFHLFDYILLLNEGETIFYGPRSQCLKHFASLGLKCPSYTNPADFLLDVLDPAEEGGQSTVIRTDGAPGIKELASSYASSKLFGQTDASIKQEQAKAHADSVALGTGKARTGVFSQFATLTARTWKASIRDYSVLLFRAGAAAAIAFLVGGIFFDQPETPDSAEARINTLLFLMCVFSLFCLPAIGRYITERVLYQRERAGGFYSTGPYYLASLLVEIPILLAIAVLYGVISYWMVGLEPRAVAFVVFLAIIFAVINIGFSVSQVISAAVKTTIMGIAIYMVVLVYSLLLGGFIVQKAKLPEGVQWLMYTSYFWYGFQGLVINEFDSKGSWGNQTIYNMGMQGGDKYANLGVLLGMWAGLQIVVFLLLRFHSKETR